MTTRRILAGLALTAVATAVALAGNGTASAWGNGHICWHGQTYTFQTEQAYYAFLGSHPGATEGDCIVVTTTVAPTTTTPRSTTSTTTASTSTSTTAPSPPSTTATTPSTAVPSTPPSSLSVPPSTPSSDLPPNDMMCSSSQESDGTVSTGCEQQSSPPSPTNTSPSDSSSTGSTLPATGRDETLTAMAAVGILALGTALVSIARRRSPS